MPPGEKKRKGQEQRLNVTINNIAASLCWAG